MSAPKDARPSSNTNQYPPSEITVDPWLKRPGSRAPVPADAVFVCRYWLNVCMWDVYESVYLRRTPAMDELWFRGEHGEGRGVLAPPHADDDSAARELFEALVCSRVGFGWPQGFEEAGLLDEAAFKAIVAGIEAELKANADEAAASETEIVRAARELGLHPVPTGKGPTHWYARCPGTQHQLLIGAGSGQFGCGYCKVKGGVMELREFVERRRR